MPGRISETVLVLISLAVLGLWSPAHADVTGKPHDLGLGNPKGHCTNCHDLHQVGLGEGFTHNLKRANEMMVCYQCHAGAFNDYTCIDPSYKGTTSLKAHSDIRGEFDLPYSHYPDGMDGEANKCSHCHDPHGVFDHASTTRKPKLLKAGVEGVTETDEFCFVCHNGDPNPPAHKFANISVRMQYRLSRTDYRQMTHSTFFRATTVS